MIVHASATNGIVIVLLITLRTNSPKTPGSQKSAIPSTMPAPIRIRKVITITPKTFQPLPLTSSRLRPNASITARRSSTITGIRTLQIVIR